MSNKTEKLTKNVVIYKESEESFFFISLLILSIINSKINFNKSHKKCKRIFKYI